MRATTGPAVPWRITASIVATTSLLLSCGGSDGSTTSSGTEPVAESVRETATTPETPVVADSTPDDAAPEDTTGAAPDTTGPSNTPEDASTGELGQAVVDVDADTYEFVVVQCLRDITGPFSDAVIEFQLDAVPTATPPDIVDNLLGVISEDVDVLAALEPVLEFGPILSITQIAGGGEVLFITDLDAIEITSDGDPTDPGARSLDVSSDPVGARVTGTTTAAGRTVTVDATCP